MGFWAVLEFAFVLVVAIACFALIIEKLHAIERVEAQAWQKQLQERIKTAR